MRYLFQTIAFLLISSMGLAQTQQGYVKTKGRLNADGEVSPGARLPDATIQAKDRQAVVSKSNGTFSFPVRNGNFYLQDVSKKGYVLTDPEVLSRSYAYSSNPLVLVLEKPEEQLEDRLLAEKKIRRTLIRQLQEKEDELEALMTAKKLEEAEYRKALQKLYAEQQNNDVLISGMADRYSKLDFDVLDEFNLRISQLILEGKLTEADSLINTKGDINTRAATLRQHQEANVLAELEIKKRQKKLEKSKALAEKELDNLAQDCYSKFEIFKLRHKNDSAAFYLKIRALLDTTKTEWQSDYAEFCHDYTSDYGESLHYFNISLQLAEKSGDERDLAAGLSNIGMLYDTLGDIEKAKECLTRAAEIVQQSHLDRDPEFAAVYTNIGYYYLGVSNYPQAEHFFRLALHIYQAAGENYTKDLAAAYTNIALVKGETENDEEAEQLLLSAIQVYEIHNLTNSTQYAQCLNSLGIRYDNAKDYQRALSYYNEALRIGTTLTGVNHPNVAVVLSNRGDVYQKMGESEKALSDYEKAISIKELLFGKDNPNLAVNYNNLAGYYRKMERYEDALALYFKALDISLSAYGKNHISICMISNNIGYTYTKTDNIEAALDYYRMSLESTASVFGNNHSRMVLPLTNMAGLYLKKGDNAMALEFYEKALSLLPESDSRVPSIKEHIQELKRP